MFVSKLRINFIYFLILVFNNYDIQCLQNDHSHENYESLLNSLINLNEERMKNINRMIRLNDNNFNGFLRTLFQDQPQDYAIAVVVKKIDARIYIKPIEASYEDTKGVSDIRNNMFFTLPHDLLRSELPQSLESEPYNALNKDHYTNSTLELNKTQMEMLRKSWHATCDKKAAKTCRKACINTYKIVCSAYLCKKSMKRSFKRECKRNCRGRFVMSKGDSE